MSATNFPEYAQRITHLLGTVIAVGEARLDALQGVDQRSFLRGFIAGAVQFDDGSKLEFREFVDVSRPEPKIMYAYHYQDAAHNLIFRYDNAAHRPALPQSEHKHTSPGIDLVPSPILPEVLDQILGQAD